MQDPRRAERLVLAAQELLTCSMLLVFALIFRAQELSWADFLREPRSKFKAQCPSFRPLENKSLECMTLQVLDQLSIKTPYFRDMLSFHVVITSTVSVVLLTVLKHSTHTMHLCGSMRGPCYF